MLLKFTLKNQLYFLYISINVPISIEFYPYAICNYWINRFGFLLILMITKMYYT